MTDASLSSEIFEGCIDSSLHLDFLPESISETAFTNLLNEVAFSEMTLLNSPVPRLVAIQGEITDENEPVYRHPTDVQPALTNWTPTVLKIKDYINDRVGQNVNHVLIQLYRSGNDNIGPHSDKTLDITRGTAILTLSLGATRTLILRPKTGNHESTSTSGNTHKIPLPSNSLFTLGSETNALYLHSIKADKRRHCEKSQEELLCSGQRISLTFRSISTYLDRQTGNLIGQGAPNVACSSGSSTSSCGAAKNDDCCMDDHLAVSERNKMINAFSAENIQINFDWDLHYGEGFRTMHKTFQKGDAS
jgi:alkylated DNA repair dioxygenase AlkB